MAVRLSAVRAGRPLPSRKIPGTHFCQRLSRPQKHNAARRIRSTEKYNDVIGNPATFRLAA
jgi:DNA polymerase II small subunit/DNA polymerase delta subunit B